MSMETEVSGADDAAFDTIVESFLARLRRGERPDVGTYVARHPGPAAELRELLSALVLVEDVKSRGGATRPDAATPEAAAARESPRDLVPAHAHLPRQLGDYRILRPLGAGGMGVVYEAVRESLNVHVALKVLHPRVRADAAFVRRFRNEARAAARLHHTNIVPVFDVGEHDGILYYVMQYIPGEGLDRVLDAVRRRRSGGSDGAGVGSVARHLLSAGAGASTATEADPNPSPNATPPPAPEATPEPASRVGRDLPGAEREAARIGAEVAEALAHAHERGVLHRDIKPSNILIDARGTAWVTDFGLAKADGGEDLTETGDVVGTIRYLAPERFENRSGPTSDVYALGTTLYEMLALRPAFDATGRMRLIQQVMNGTPPPLRRIAPHIPRDLETIVAKAMARDPASRYATAAALAEDLRLFLDDRPIRGRRMPPLERLWRWGRRNPATAGLAAALAAVFAVAFLAVGAALWQARVALELAGRRQQAAILSERDAVHQRAQADAGFLAARAAVDAYLSAITESERLRDPELLPLRRELLGSAQRFYETFLRDHESDPSLRADLASTHLRLARVLGPIDAGEAARHFARARDLYAALSAAKPFDPVLLAGLAESQAHGGDPARAVAAAERLMVEFPDFPRAAALLADAYDALGTVLDRRGDPAGAAEARRRAATVRDGPAAPDDGPPPRAAPP